MRKHTIFSFKRDLSDEGQNRTIAAYVDGKKHHFQAFDKSGNLLHCKYTTIKRIFTWSTGNCTVVLND